MKGVYVIFAILCCLNLICGQTFTDIEAELSGVNCGSVAWGDYDNDGDLDILLTGCYTSKIYRNDSGIFTDIEADLTVAYDGLAAWGDYDNDGDLDILMAGTDYSSNVISKIYRNDFGLFVDINAGLIGIQRSSAAWGDYDNDGDLDIVMSGLGVNELPIAKIYRNDEGNFTDIGADIIGASNPSVAWGDYDNDGDLDVLMTHYYFPSKIYRNDSGVFTDINAEILNSNDGSAAWGDYDNDGDLDILLTGNSWDWDEGTSGSISKIFQNDSGIFTDINAGLIGAYFSSAVWGDYDNDGDLDILISGWGEGIGYMSRIYRNDSGTFTDINAGLTGLNYSSAAWGDYDNDGDLDILLTGSYQVNNGQYIYSERFSKIYRNDSVVSNSTPNLPTNLTSSNTDSTVTFTWDKATDNETPQDGLSYNFYIGRSSGGSEKMSSMSDTASGYRKIVARGNAQQDTTWTINHLEDGTYYWSVQAVDHGFAGSEFAPEQMFCIGSMYPPANVEITNEGTVVNLTWSVVAGATSYKIYASDDPYGIFENVSLDGDFDGTSWSQTIGVVKKFYYIVAVSE